jgi:hypothetical protein
VLNTGRLDLYEPKVTSMTDIWCQRIAELRLNMHAHLFLCGRDELCETLLERRLLRGCR